MSINIRHCFKTFSENHRHFLEALILRIEEHYSDRLCSLAVYGSYARGENRMNSDLDLFLVVSHFSRPGRLVRSEEFVKHVEGQLDTLSFTGERDGIVMELSPVILTPEEASHFMPLYLDMTQHVVILKDVSDFLKNRLLRVGEQMKRWGSRKQTAGPQTYWDIKPGLRWGEIFDYDQ